MVLTTAVPILDPMVAYEIAMTSQFPHMSIISYASLWFFQMYIMMTQLILIKNVDLSLIL